MRRLTLNVLIALCIATILTIGLLSVVLNTAHAASQAGHITGKLLDGSNKNAPLAGQQVTLQMAQGPNTQDLTTSSTDASGAYTFPNLATDKTINYAVYIRYQGAQYVSDLTSLADKPEQQIDLTVYQATSSSAKLAVVHASLLVHQPDAQKGIITISEVFSFKNLDTHTYVGSLDSSKGKPNALLFSLPAHARSINLSHGFTGYQVIQVDSGFATDAAVLPGDSEFSFSFDVPYSAVTYDLSYTTMYPTVDLSVLVPPELQASSSALTVQGVVTADQHPYRVFDSKQLLAQQSLHLSLGGLSVPVSTSTPAPVNTNWVWLIVGLLIMVAVIFVTLVISRFQRFFGSKSRRRSGSKHGSRRHVSKERDEPEHAAKAHPPRKAPDRKQELLHELLALDKSFEAGKISKAVYQERRAKTKARLRSLMSERETARR